MTVTIDPNIKKQRIFINKNGERVTEEQMFGGRMGNVLGSTEGTTNDSKGEKDKA